MKPPLSYVRFRASAMTTSKTDMRGRIAEIISARGPKNEPAAREGACG